MFYRYNMDRMELTTKLDSGTLPVLDKVDFSLLFISIT